MAQRIQIFPAASLPPGTPEARVEILRTALKEPLEDPAFKADAKKSNLIVASLSGEEIQKLVNQTLSISPEAKKVLESLIGRGKEQI